MTIGSQHTGNLEGIGPRNGNSALLVVACLPRERACSSGALPTGPSSQDMSSRIAMRLLLLPVECVDCHFVARRRWEDPSFHCFEQSLEPHPALEYGELAHFAARDLPAHRLSECLGLFGCDPVLLRLLPARGWLASLAHPVRGCLPLAHSCFVDRVQHRLPLSRVVLLGLRCVRCHRTRDRRTPMDSRLRGNDRRGFWDAPCGLSFPLSRERRY